MALGWSPSCSSQARTSLERVKVITSHLGIDPYSIEGPKMTMGSFFRLVVNVIFVGGFSNGRPM